MKKIAISMQIDPRLAVRVKVAAAKLRISKSTLIEQCVLDKINELELQAAAKEGAR